MADELKILLVTAATIGLIHTVIGPDHYIPFIAMAKARSWSMAKTWIITILCGIGHVLSSVVIGLVGIAAGIALTSLETVESVRGEIAAWALIAFGLLYCVWGLHRAYKNKTHTHSHAHIDGHEHEHTHSHMDEHGHVHENPAKPSITPWILFTIFAFGPCEPLIPLLMYPASTGGIADAALVAGVFSICTVFAMLVTVTLGIVGIRNISLGKLERYSHALAGFAIFASGLAIQFLGL